MVEWRQEEGENKHKEKGRIRTRKMEEWGQGKGENEEKKNRRLRWRKRG